jgi:hypothetical protein
MLTLITCDHIDRLLHKIEIVLLVASSRREIEIPVDECLSASIEKRVNVTLVPAALFNRLEFSIQIIEPLPDVTLIRL